MATLLLGAMMIIDYPGTATGPGKVVGMNDIPHLHRVFNLSRVTGPVSLSGNPRAVQPGEITYLFCAGPNGKGYD